MALCLGWRLLRAHQTSRPATRQETEIKEDIMPARSQNMSMLALKRQVGLMAELLLVTSSSASWWCSAACTGLRTSPQCTADPSLHQPRLQKLSLFHPSAFPESRSAIKYQELCNWNSFAPDVAPRSGAGPLSLSDDDPFSFSSSASTESPCTVGIPLLFTLCLSDIGPIE